MKYVCSHCGTVVESDEKPAKCPNCLRKHGLIPEGEANKKTNEKRRIPWKLVAVAAAVILVAGGGVWWWSSHRSSNEKPPSATHRMGPQPAAALSAAMVQAGAPKLPLPFAASDRITSWARKHIQGATPKAKAHNLQKALHGLLDGKSCKKPSDRITAQTLLSAKQVLAHSGQKPCHSFAMAALGLAAARAAGLKATMAELFAPQAKSGDDQATPPLDPTGGQGRFGIAVFAKGYDDPKPAAILDPLSAQGSKVASYQLLDDLSALAAYLNLKAQVVAANDPPTARMLAEAAAKLGPDSASVQCGAGTVLIALGGLSEGSDAVLKAVGIRDDAPRQLCLAMAKMASRDVAGAMKALQKATKKNEAFATAYGVQARIMLAMGQPAKASELLDRAEQYRPGLRSVRVLRAMLTAMQGNLVKATSALEKLLQEQPDDPDAFQALWQIYVSTGMSEEADKLAKKFAENMPAQARARFLAQMSEHAKAIAKMQQAASSGGAGAPGPGPSAPGPSGGPATQGGGSALPAPGPGPLNTPAPNMDFKLKAPTTGPSGPGAGPKTGPKLDLNM